VLTLTEVVAGLDAHIFSESELNQAYLERIKQFNPELNCYLSVCESSQ
jgi:Asp-tRNA(Asn)/Glu-tRNA(Gln) amidotransferase A subunit family amidase